MALALEATPRPLAALEWHRVRHEASVLRLEPCSPVRRRRVADVGDGWTAREQGRWHAPAHSHHLGTCIGVTDHGRRIVRKHARHRRQVADLAVDHAEERNDCGLIGRDAALLLINVP
jgi:hypothetical protein